MEAFLILLERSQIFYAGISFITMSVRAKNVTLKDESNIIDEQ